MLVITSAIFATMMALFAIGFSVAVALGLTALVAGAVFSDRPITDALSYVPWNTVTNSALVALPLFILMGEILLRAGITEKMYASLAKWMGRLPGGLLHTNIAASGLFACISGSSAATAATIGSVAVPYLNARSYDSRTTLGSIAAGGTLGILIPPSLVMIVYAVLAGESVGKLYIAGIVPGIVLMMAFFATIIILATLKPGIAPVEPKASWPEKIRAIGGIAPIFGLIAVVIGTIYAGVATATEAAAFGVVGAMLIAIASRKVSARMLREAFLATAVTTSMIVFILVGAFFLQFVLSFLGIPNAIARWIVGLEMSAMQVVLLICGLYLVLGMFMESLSMVVITIPVLLPLLKTLGIDLVWFGIIVVVLVEAALITPPVGLNLFILQGLARQHGLGKAGSSIEIFWGVLPFLVALLLVLGLLLAFPSIALWLGR